MSLPTVPRRPGEAYAPRHGTPGKSSFVLLFIGLMLAMLLGSLDQTVLSTALPTVVGELHGVERMSWVVTIYVLASTVVMPVYGRVSDVLGRKPVLATAIVLFVAGSVLGGAAADMNWLIAGRGIQGLGGGGLMIMTQAAIADTVPARQRGKYMGIMGAVFAVSSVAGPLLGGWLTEGPGWRWTFWINVPLGALALIATLMFLNVPKRPRADGDRTDYVGMVLVASATAAVVLVCTWGGSEYDWNSPQILGLIAAAVVLAVVFVLVERRAASPVIPMSLFRSRAFVIPTVAALCTGIAMFGVVGYMPTYIQMVSGVDATEAGLLMTPMMASLLIASVVSGALVSKTGRYKIFPVLGSGIVAVGLWLLSTLRVDDPTWLLCTYTAVLGIGIGLSMQLLITIVQNAMPDSMAGTATAAVNYFRQVGATVGSAIVGSVFASRLTTNLHDGLAALREQLAGQAARSGNAGASQAGGLDAVGGGGSLTPETVAHLPGPVHDVVLNSYNDALLPIFAWLVPFGVAAMLVLLFLKEEPLKNELGSSPEPVV